MTHYLPSLASFQNFNLNDSCVNDFDCPKQMICVIPGFGASWAFPNQTATKYMRHDDEPGSLHYIPVPRPSSESFCSCPTFFGYTGYECLDYDVSWYFEFSWDIIAALWCLSTITQGIHLLYISRRSFKFSDSIVRGILLCMLSAGIIFSSIIAQLLSMFSPKDMIASLDPDEAGRKLPAFENVWVPINAFVGPSAIVSALHVVYCWIEVYETMNNGAHKSRKATIAKRMILVGEIGLFVGLFSMSASGNMNYSFVVAVPFLFGVVFCCIYAMRLMSSLTLKYSTANDSDPQIIKLREMVQEIRIHSKFILLMFLIGFIGFAYAFVFIGLGIWDATQSPEGSFNRPNMWGNNIPLYLALPGVNFVVLHYLRLLVLRRLERHRKSYESIRKRQMFAPSLFGDVQNPYLVRFQAEQDKFVPESEEFIEKNCDAEVIEDDDDDDIQDEEENNNNNNNSSSIQPSSPSLSARISSDIESTTSTTTTKIASVLSKITLRSKTIITDAALKVKGGFLSRTKIGQLLNSKVSHAIFLSLIALVAPICALVQMGYIEKIYSVIMIAITPFIFMTVLSALDLDVFIILLKKKSLQTKMFFCLILFLSGMDVFMYDLRILTILGIVNMILFMLFLDAFVNIRREEKKAIAIIGMLSIIVELILIFTDGFRNIQNRSFKISTNFSFSIYGLYRDTLISLFFASTREFLFVMRGRDNHRMNNLFEPVKVTYRTLLDEKQKRGARRIDAEAIKKTIELGAAGGGLIGNNNYAEEGVAASRLQVASGFLMEKQEKTVVGESGQSSKQVVAVYCDSIVVRERSLLAIKLFGMKHGQTVITMMNHRIYRIFEFLLIVVTSVVTILVTTGVLQKQVGFVGLLGIGTILFSFLRMSKAVLKLLFQRIDIWIDIISLILWAIANGFVFHFDTRAIMHGYCATIITRFYLSDASFNRHGMNNNPARRIVLVLGAIFGMFVSLAYHVSLILGKFEDIVISSTSNNNFLEVFDPVQFSFSFGLSVSVRCLLLIFETIKAEQLGSLRDIKRPVSADLVPSSSSSSPSSNEN